MQRFISGSLRAILIAIAASGSMSWVAAAEPGETKADVNRRFLEASLRVAEKELSQSQEAVKRAAGSVSAAEIDRLRANVEKSRAELALANVQGGEEQPKDNANEAAIRHALNGKTVFEFVETPLADVIEFLKGKHKIEIQLDKKALDNAGLGSDTPITRNLRDISLRSALRLTLKEFDLTWLIENEVLMITTVDEAGQRLVSQVYDVDDLVSVEGGVDYDSLIDTITSIVAPTTWEDVGGPGAVSPLHRMLVVNQTGDVHEQIISLLAELRRVRKERGDKIAVDRPAETAPVDPQSVTVKVYKVTVPMMPRSAIKPASAKPNVVGNNEPSLAQTLAQFGGGMGGGGTNRGAAGGMGGLAPSNEGTAPNDQYLIELAAAIPGLVQPDSWAKNGGQGTIYALPADAAGNAQLLVRQSGDVHAKLQKFLSELSPKPGAGGGFGGMGGGFGGMGGGSGGFF